MPCYDHRDGDDCREAAAKVNALTRMLCSVLGVLDTNSFFTGEHAEVAQWWKEHQAADRRHRREEAHDRRMAELKEQAIRKLTPDERKALGLP